MEQLGFQLGQTGNRLSHFVRMARSVRGFALKGNNAFLEIPLEKLAWP